MEMEEEVQKVQFESTLEEIADVRHRLVSRTKTYRHSRSRAIVILSIFSFLSCLLLVRLVSTSEELSGPEWRLWATVALLVGCGSAFFWGGYYDKAVQRQLKSYLEEQPGMTAAHFLCEIELRDDGVWVRQNGVDTVFPWAGARRIVDNGN